METVQHHSTNTEKAERAANSQHKVKKENIFRLSMSATFHCLIGCGIGEVGGIIIGTAFSMDMMSTMALAVTLGFIGGLGLGIIPLIRAGFIFKKALKTVVIAEGLSIVVMEAFEILTQFVIPGVMEAELSEPIFWYGMMAALAVGFVAAFPVNYVMIKKGVRHKH